IPKAEAAQQVPPTPKDSQFASLADLVLDVRELAEMPKAALINNLRRLDNAYRGWISNESRKMDDATEKLEDHKAAPERALERCQRAFARIEEGIDLIESDSKAEDAFRFAHRAVWQQRVRTTFARRARIRELKQGE